MSKYEKERLQHNVPIMLGVHGLQRMYSTDFSPFVILRSIGLQVTQSVPVLKVNIFNFFLKNIFCLHIFFFTEIVYG